MTLKEFNEGLNLFSVFFQLIPIYLGLKFCKSNNTIMCIVLLLFLTFTLDLVVFYQYKILKNDVGWLNNFYILIATITLIPFHYFSSKINNIPKIVFTITSLALIFTLVNEYLIKNSFFKFSSTCWVAVQIFVTLNSSISLFFFIRSNKQTNQYIAQSYFQIALLSVYSLPVFINLTQPYLKINFPIIYTSSFIFMNILGLIFSLLIILGLKKFRLNN